jgi:tRNA dimethylallyltransferase
VKRRPPESFIYAIAGPTCSGKTALGVRLAKHVGGEVVNFDSVQLYKGIQIATAKPTEEEKQGIPHHLIDYVDPKFDHTAADWAADAAKTIIDIESRRKVAILVGGTGFYLRTLRRPLFESPKTDRDLRERFRRLKERKGPEHLHELLSQVDPDLAAKLPSNDYVRVMRGLEVFFQTGEKLSEKQPNRLESPEFASRIRLFVLNPPRGELYERINRRTEVHFENGLVTEVNALLSQGLNEAGNALGAHAYRRVCEYLRGERDLLSAIEQSKQDVRNYAKRQLTWFRREKDAVWLDGFGNEEAVWERLLGLIDAKKGPEN